MKFRLASLGEYRQFLVLGSLLAISWSLLQFYAGYDGTFPTMVLRPLHVTLAAAVVFAMFPLIARSKLREDASEEDKRPGWDRKLGLFLVLVCLAIGFYFVANRARYDLRIPFVDDLTLLDLVVGSVLILVVLEATRRVAGIALPALCVIFLLYNVIGPWIPGDLRHSGITLVDFIDLQSMSTQAIFGVPTGVSSSYVFYFILFAAFLEVSGGGALFIDFALATVGRRRGGGAKAAIVGSSLFGMISGSAVANVTGSGIFTIPLMKRIGYSSTFAGAVEALASTGGQLMPPLMGAGAFIMAQMLGRPYADIALAAAIPAVLYFMSAYFMVDFQARKEGLRGLSRDEMPDLRESVVRLQLLLPIIYLVYAVMTGFSLMTAALHSIILCIVVSYFRRATWFTLPMFLTALVRGGRNAVSVALPCAAAGIVVGVTVQSGLGLKFSGLIVTMASGQLYLGLVLVMLGCVLMGMGLPTTAAYILAAVLMVPALTQMGVNELAAHMFVFYFACVSMITPPVALASYAASAISGASMSATGWTAFRIGLAAYLVPYAFVFGPAMVLEGSWDQIVLVSMTAAVGIYCLAGGVIGYLRCKNQQWETVVLFVSAFALIWPNLYVSVIGALGLASVLLNQFRTQRRDETIGRDGDGAGKHSAE